VQDRSIAVWDMVAATDINLHRVLVGHRAAVNVVDFDEKYIVSASGDRTIKVRDLIETRRTVNYLQCISINKCLWLFRSGTQVHVNLSER